MIQVSSGSSLLTRTISPVKFVSGSPGATTSTLTVNGAPLGRSVPPSGSNVQSHQSGHSDTSQSSNEPGSPIFSTVKLPVTSSPAFTLGHDSSPSHSRSGTIGI